MQSKARYATALYILGIAVEVTLLAAFVAGVIVTAWFAFGGREAKGADYDLFVTVAPAEPAPASLPDYDLLAECPCGPACDCDPCACGPDLGVTADPFDEAILAQLAPGLRRYVSGCPGGNCPLPIRVATHVPSVEAIPASRSNWTYPGDIASHLRSGHPEIAPSLYAGLSVEQMEELHDAAHEGRLPRRPAPVAARTEPPVIVTDPATAVRPVRAAGRVGIVRKCLAACRAALTRVRCRR